MNDYKQLWLIMNDYKQENFNYFRFINIHNTHKDFKTRLKINKYQYLKYKQN